jgi:hypothetical protein
MKFSIESLIRQGMLGGAHVQMERVEIRACLGEPDDWIEPNKDPCVVDRAPIWRYGSFEVHFFLDDSVSMLFTDYLDEPEAGQHRDLDAWILCRRWKRTLQAVRAELEPRDVEFEELKDRRGAPLLRVRGGADLTFDDPDGEWEWGAIVVDAAVADETWGGRVQHETATGWEKVYTVPDWYDGPRRGVANFEGRPHLFESEFADLEDAEDVFRLSPLDDETLKLALEDWQIWLRWERAFHAKETSQKTHPALPEDRRRWEELQRQLLEAGVVHPDDGEGPPMPTADPNRAVRATAEFEPSGTPNGHASLRVRWKRL